MGKLQGKVALITGAARGQGEAEARLFVEEGAQVVLGDMRDDLGKVVAESLGSSALYMNLDVSREESWASYCAGALEAFGKIDVLVNNAGILKLGSIAETPLDDYMHVIQVNQVGVFLGMKAVLAPMTEAGGGSIVNISSIGGLAGIPGMVSYVSSKFAVRGMTKTAALEFGALGIRVNSVHPGAVDTPMIAPSEAGDGAADVSNIRKGLPLQRISDPAEIAKLVAFLASDESSYCTGSEFTADGGMMAGMAG
ncbi:MAG: glucose 1-dehydrogenase [Myxococcota bacterium]|nr:glucose 1-dehydrogenase [Myxococcota bacterium]